MQEKDSAYKKNFQIRQIDILDLKQLCKYCDDKNY